MKLVSISYGTKQGENGNYVPLTPPHQAWNLQSTKIVAFVKDMFSYFQTELTAR